MNVYPVIHYLDRTTAFEQARLAHRVGAQGVFLISHRGRDTELAEVARGVKLALPGFKVGVNLLSRGPVEAIGMALANELDMVWADRMGVDSRGLSPVGKTCSVQAQQGSLELFSSVAFKYQPEEPDPVEAARQALRAGFVPTTSGPGTGQAPTVEKIRAMSEATQGKLAVASGMTPENIRLYRPYLSDVLVATGISSDEHHLDASLLSEFLAYAGH